MKKLGRMPVEDDPVPLADKPIRARSDFAEEAEKLRSPQFVKFTTLFTERVGQ